MSALEDDHEHRYFRDDEPGDVETPDDAAPPIDEPDEIAQLARCDWHLRRLARIRHDIAVVDAVYKAEIDRLQIRHETRRARLLGAAAWHEAPLMSYMAMRRETDGIKSLELPHGTLKSRTPSKHSITIVDEDVFIGWANDHMAELVRTVEKPDARAIGKAGFVATFPTEDDVDGAVVVPDTGERVPGAIARRAVTTYSVVTEDEAQP